MRSYQKLLYKVLNEGVPHDDRTGVGTRSLFGEQLKIDMMSSFPLLTTKKVNFKAVVAELLWFLRGDTNIDTLGCKIWDYWADSDGEVGPSYGYQWRQGFGIDQIRQLQQNIDDNPNSRRHIVTAWNPGSVKDVILPPCHVMWQVKVYKQLGQMSICLYQRSADIFLGVPFNIASYATLLHLLCASHGYEPRELTMMFGDIHLYGNHVEQAKTQISRNALQLPRLLIKEAKQNLWEYTTDDIELIDYVSHEALKAQVAI